MAALRFALCAQGTVWRLYPDNWTLGLDGVGGVGPSRGQTGLEDRPAQPLPPLHGSSLKTPLE